MSPGTHTAAAGTAGERSAALPTTGGEVWAAVAAEGEALRDEQLEEVFQGALGGRCRGEKVLLLVPDSTRDVPMARLVRLALEALEEAASVEVMVALGTHPPMRPDALAQWLGVPGERTDRLQVTVSNHDWAAPDALAAIGTVPATRLQEIAGPYWHQSLGGDLVIRVNRAAVQADRVVVLGPTLPHEVAGYSGGGKYLFPGISGPEMIDVMHWLGALAGVLATIGLERTPVRELIEEAASLLPTPVTLLALATGAGAGARDVGTTVQGAYAGDMDRAWAASVAHASRLHTRVLDRPVARVISCAMPIYGELWTAAKAMYKLEGAVADGGELVIYAPHLSQVSVTHGREIFEVGYHVLAYFLSQWQRFEHRSLAVLAHSTHVKGAGAFDASTGEEQPRIEVKLATALPAADCARLNLGFEDIGAVGREVASPPEGTLVVPRAGEVLYRAL